MSKFLVVNFHGIGPIPPSTPADEQRVWCEDISHFRSMLDTITLAQTSKGIPIKITFDDGNASDLHLALPELVRRNCTASFFVCAGRIGAKGYLDGTGIRQLLAAGMEVGSHGWSHTDWRKADDAELTREVDHACDRIAQETGADVTSVALPFGSFDRRVLLRANRFNTIYNSEQNYARSGARFVARFGYSTDWSSDQLAKLVANDGGNLRYLLKTVSQFAKGMR